MQNIDPYDAQILRILQRDGKIGLQELAKQVNLSTSPCWRRVRKLEQAGVIDRYVAVLNSKLLKLQAVAYVHVSLVDHSEAAIAKFEQFVQVQEQIVECASITGDHDFVLKVYAHDPEALEFFILRKILGLGVVRASKTDFVLRQTKASTALPLSG